VAANCQRDNSTTVSEIIESLLAGQAQPAVLPVCCDGGWPGGCRHNTDRSVSAARRSGFDTHQELSRTCADRTTQINK
jgi:hypothetical protein